MVLLAIGVPRPVLNPQAALAIWRISAGVCFPVSIKSQHLRTRSKRFGSRTTVLRLSPFRWFWYPSGVGPGSQPDSAFARSPRFTFVLGLAVCLERSDDFDAMLLHGPDDGAAVHGVASETIQLPAEDSIRFTAIQALHQGIEYRTPWSFGRFGFGHHGCNLYTVLYGVPFELTDLRIN